ncbi:hypothetical protein CR513_18402, partial [Mucuna pruriens]
MRFVDFFRLDKNQFDKSIKRLQSNTNTKFVNLEFSKFLKDNCVVHKLTCVNTPQQNGISERKNRHLLEVTRVLLFQMYVPNVYWGEAVLTATYLINRLATRALNGISSIKHMLSLFPSSPLMLSLPSRVFGYVALVHSHNPHHGKLDPRVVKCVFIGYPSNKKGFKCYHPPSSWVLISMDVTFHETESFFVSPPLQGENVQVQEITPTQDVQVQEVTRTQDVQVQEVTPKEFITKKAHNEVGEKDRYYGKQYQRHEKPTLVNIPENPIEDVTDDIPTALRKGKQSCVKYFISYFVCTNHLSIQHQIFIVVIDAIKTPTSVQEALKDENWVQAMKEEIKALVAKGYTQTYGIDYEETFAPVTKMNTVGVILSLAAHFGWNLQQFDVKNVFLHGDLEEEVYMEIPSGFYSHNEKNKVCKLKKALYGLKQSSRAWFERFAQVMISLGYRQSQSDHTLFIKHSPNGKLTRLLVYVDDMIVTGDDKIEKLTLKEKQAT